MTDEEKKAVNKTIALIECVILALERLNMTDCEYITETLRETRKYTDKLYESCEGE